MARRVRKFNALTKKYKNAEGIEELIAKLNEMANTEEKSNALRYDIRGVLQKAGLHIRDAAVGFAPSRPANIKRAIISAFGEDKQKDATTIVMALFKVSPWWHWWEFGTSGRYTKTGAYRGAIKAVKFMRRGTAAARPAVAATIGAGIKDVLKVYEV